MTVLIYELKDFYHFWPILYCFHFFMFSAASLETSVFTEWHLYKASVKMIDMQVVRLTYHVIQHLIISEKSGNKKLISPIWMWTSAVIRIKNNKDVNKPRLSIRFLNFFFCILFTWKLLFCCHYCHFLRAWIYFKKLVSQ